MTTATHTPGPWAINHTGMIIIDAAGGWLADTRTVQRGIEEDKANARRIATACNAHDQLVAENAALRADLNDARSNWESGAEELRQADIAGAVVAEQAAPILGERITKETFQTLCYVKTWFSMALTLLPTVAWNESGQEVAEELQALLNRNFAVQLTAEEAKRLGYVAATVMPDPVREQLVAALQLAYKTLCGIDSQNCPFQQYDDEVATIKAALIAVGVSP